MTAVSTWFLDANLAHRAIDLSRHTIKYTMSTGETNREHLHMIISARDFEGRWQTLAERSWGNKDVWEAPYDDIAHGKDAISRRTGLTSREVQLQQPHLLHGRDTIYWGNAVAPGVIVSCSGVQPWFDQAFSQATLAMLLALCQDELEGKKKRGTWYT